MGRFKVSAHDCTFWLHECTINYNGWTYLFKGVSHISYSDSDQIMKMFQPKCPNENNTPVLRSRLQFFLCGHYPRQEVFRHVRTKLEHKKQCVVADSNGLSVILIGICGSSDPHVTDYTTLTRKQPKTTFAYNLSLRQCSVLRKVWPAYICSTCAIRLARSGTREKNCCLR